MQTVVGLYDRFEDAQRVVQALREAGFERDNISMVARDAKGDYSRQLQGGEGEKQNLKDGAATGAGIGAVLGGLGGLLVGLGALAIPGIGPVLAAGPLVTAIAGAGVGAVAGGLVGALVDLGIPEEHAQMYAEGVRRGGTLVVVQTEDQMADQAAQIMNRFNPVDLNERSGNWGQRDQWGQQEMAHDQMEFNREDMAQEMRQEENIPVTGERDNMTIPIVEEDIEVGKRQVDRGGVRVQTFTREEPVQKDINLRNEHVTVERRPVDRPASDKDFEAFKEGTYEFKETGEEPVVQKTSRVVEEVDINKDVEERTHTVEDTVRRQDVNVEPLTSRKWNDVNKDFQQNYQTTYGMRGQGYEYYQPAYRMGYELANNPQYRDYDWNRLEPVARQEWQRQRMQGRWEDVRDAVYYAWRRMTS